MKKRKAVYTVTSLKDIESCCHSRSSIGLLLKTCGNRTGAAGLYYAPRDKKGQIPYVCNSCFKPIYTGTFQWYYQRCENCLEGFSSPWEDICEKCHRIEHSDIKMEGGRVVASLSPDAPVYRGWQWGVLKHTEGELAARTARLERRREKERIESKKLA